VSSLLYIIDKHLRHHQPNNWMCYYISTVVVQRW